MILNNENYYSIEANKEYLSVSQFKDFIYGCEAKAIAKLNGEYQEEKTDALLVGSYVDTWCEGTLEEFKEKNAEYIFSKSVKKEKVLLSKFQQAEDIIKVIQNDKILTKSLTGEKQKIFTAELFDIKWKIKMDCYNPELGFFSDLKIMAKLDDKFYNKELQRYENFIQHYHYNLQMCVYALIEKEATQRDEFLEPYIVAVSKENPSNKEIYKGFLTDMDEIIWDLETYLPRIIALKEGKEKPILCNKCDYCRKIKTTQIVDYHTILE